MSDGATPIRSDGAIGIHGAGAIGCYLGGRLVAAGLRAIFVGRQRLRAEIQAHGITLRDLDGTTSSVPAGQIAYSTDPSALASSRVVLVCVKSAHTAAAGRELAAVLPPASLVVSMQNGVRNADVLRAELPGHTVLGGIVSFNVVPRGEGLFARATSGPLIIEASTDPRLPELARALRAAGFEVAVRHDIVPLQWSKLLLNLNNAVGALTGAPTRDLVFHTPYRRVLAMIIGESLEVLARAGIRPARLGPLPPRFYPYALRLPTPLLRIVARAQLRIDPEARSSMWQDLSRGAPTEVDHLNGEIVRLAESVGADAPVNRRIVSLIKDAERAANGSPQLSADALYQALT